MYLHELKFDENNNCRLQVGDELQLDVLRDERLSRYVLTAPVAMDLPEGTTYSLMQDLLCFAMGPVFDGSPAVGRDPGSGLLLAYSILPYAIATREDFPRQLERFVEFVMAMTAKFTAIERGEDVVARPRAVAAPQTATQTVASEPAPKPKKLTLGDARIVANPKKG